MSLEGHKNRELFRGVVGQAFFSNIFLNFDLARNSWAYWRCSNTYMLDYSIIGPFTHSISSGFYDWTSRGGSSSMLSEPKSWIQFPLTKQFSAARISLSLGSAGPTGTTAPKQEQASPIVSAHMQEGEC
jgi:hypothetical protein